jgi:ubiquinone/menaquinone biosynthesis C-methylase UbiE
MESVDIEQAVRLRYAAGARRREAALCCPVSYDERYLEVLPAEILERDYGCGDPSVHARDGETVLDLGSGSGKICFITAQRVGPAGRVIGVDCNEEMLALARRHQPDIARRLGFDTVEFRRGRIQDLRGDLDAADAYLRASPVASVEDLIGWERFAAEQRRAAPLVADDSVDLVVSNCVLNLVRDEEKRALFGEIFRVLRPGGRAVISDIVSDEPVPDGLKSDHELWTGCIAGALPERDFIAAFAAAGLYGIEILERATQPWQTVNGIEFRALTVRAWKGKQGACWDHHQAVIYRGPWSEVRDDDGHVLQRGVPMAVCEKTFRLYTREPYAADLVPVEPLVPVQPDAARPFDCARDAVRDPRETKGDDYRATTTAAPSCGPSGCC